MTAVLQILHSVYLGVLFILLCVGSGAIVRRWLGLPVAFLLPIGFGCTALAGLVSFFAWWLSPIAGSVVSLAFGLGGVALVASKATGADSIIREDLKTGWPLVAATLLLAASWLCLLQAGGVPAAQRFTWDLPIDDQLPRMFADKLAAGESPTPLAGDWLSSDRPPLQTGIVLLFRPFELSFHDQDLSYETIATLCQIMWLPALAALGLAISLDRRRMVAGLFFCSTAGFFLVNTLYVWPKLMAASLALTAIALLASRVLHSNEDKSPRRIRIALATGALLALATLAHGGIWFSLLALPALPVAWTALRRFGIVGMLVLGCTFAAVNAPWSAYKATFDPPGNRLVKWHIAGAIDIDGRSSLETIRDAYAAKSPGEILRDRYYNLVAVAFVPRQLPDESWDGYLRRIQFFNLLPAVGLPLLGIGWLVLASIRGRTRHPVIEGLIGYSMATILLWIALMFIPMSTVVHQGSFVPVALLIFLGGAMIGGWRMPALIGIGLAHSSVFLAAWILTTPPDSAGPQMSALLGISIVLAVAFWAVLLLVSRTGIQSGGPAAQTKA